MNTSVPNEPTSESVDCLPPDEEVTPYWTILDLLKILEAGGVNPNAIIEVKECTRVDNPPKQSSDPTRYYVITIRKRK